jgi:hypothetical protein
MSVQSLLQDPNEEDPLVPSAAEMYCNDRERYTMMARSYTKNFAFLRIPDLESTVEDGTLWYLELQVVSIGQDHLKRSGTSPALQDVEAQIDDTME